MTAPRLSTPVLSEIQIHEFHTHYIKGQPDGCWPWLAWRNREGYGVIQASRPSRERYYAHRVAFWLHYGYWPTLCVLHSCDNPSCVNPDHLHEGTRAQNNAECVARGRRPIGERAGRTKLSPDDVRAIRQLSASGEYPVGIGRKFGVTSGAVQGIVKGKSWKWLT